MNYYTEPFKKYAVFSGRSTRKEYWLFLLFNILVILVIRIVSSIIGAVIHSQILNDLVYIYYLIAIVPSLSLSARRLHDTNRSAWWLLLLIPTVVEMAGLIKNDASMTVMGSGILSITSIILIVFYVFDSQPGDNKYGLNPKGVSVNQPEQKIKSTAGWVFGGLSFIPLVGVFFGIIAITIGATKKIKGQIFLGIAGILLTVILYGGLYYFGFISTTGPWADLRIQLASQIINTDAGQISLYKSQRGTLPTKLSDLGTPSPTNMFYTSDPWMTDLLYTLNSDGSSFELRSAGPDKIMNTPDDIVQTFK